VARESEALVAAFPLTLISLSVRSGIMIYLSTADGKPNNST